MITLIRHGQAGSRVVYDDLSETGRAQSRALGAWFGERGVRFDTIVAGGLVRQRITAEEMVSAMAASGGVSKPEIITDARWSEFDLDHVYAGIGPLLAKEDERFRLEYEELQRDAADPASPVHRAWRNCDVTVVRAWMDGRFEWEGESFAAFGERVRAALFALSRDAHIAVVTSATPMALCAGAALDLAPRRVMQLAGAVRNSAFSEIALAAAGDGSGGARLISFNNVPHLRDELQTLR